jgi:hypothetical protein
MTLVKTCERVSFPSSGVGTLHDNPLAAYPFDKAPLRWRLDIPLTGSYLSRSLVQMGD